MRSLALGCLVVAALSGCAGTDATGLSPQEVNIIIAPKTRCTEVRDEVGAQDGVLVRCAASDAAFVRAVEKTCRDDPTAMERETDPRFLMATTNGEIVRPRCP